MGGLPRNVLRFSNPVYPPRGDEELDDLDRKIIDDVSALGWHCVLVTPSVSGSGYAFTIGLFRTYRHPELMVAGYPGHRARALLDRLAQSVASGTTFGEGEEHEGLADSRCAAFRGIAVEHYQGYLDAACWYHGGSRFPALQCFWSDLQGRFPWQESFDPRFRDLQPLLFTAPRVPS